MRDTLDKLLNITNIGSKFYPLSEIKAKSLLGACDTKVDVKNDSFLIIGSNLIPMGLVRIGADKVTVLNGNTVITDDNSKRSIQWVDGDLYDFSVQGIEFDWVIAPDEYLCLQESEEAQKSNINAISKIAKKGFITTFIDYKNLGNNKKHFDEPFQLKSDAGDAILIRSRQWSRTDRQRWTQQNYIIQNQKLTVCEPYVCRTMYFKQLAKFTSDAGAKNFCVDKKTMYKALFRKEFEYIVVITF
jgi:hypothetical protein